ncbi:hypothetical protein PoB_002165900 [Plakobranchus ocellatus]|uniref:Uncharacterized protein n=1 Tax=Plakobranchus ocellatus TaxID=259542 RepID=A0AAV3ZMQ1_9GAST|nr:hypothetical protein PoB_002165900 [Plakobranchus ocellatus]
MTTSSMSAAGRAATEPSSIKRKCWNCFMPTNFLQSVAKKAVHWCEGTRTSPASFQQDCTRFIFDDEVTTSARSARLLTGVFLWRRLMSMRPNAPSGTNFECPVIQKLRVAAL